MANAKQLALLRKSVGDWNKHKKSDKVIPDLQGADLHGACLSGADLFWADLFGADLHGADLGEANLSVAKLIGADLEEANLGATRLVGANLRGANLIGANLIGANLRGANLIAAHLHGADLVGAKLGGANLREADLSGANLSQANLGGANLDGADLGGAYLIGVTLSWAHLDGASISEARVGRTSFGDVDLSVVKGLGSVDHKAPSTIGVDTILKSGGQIPDEFLRGCGVDGLIQKMLVGDAKSQTDAFSEWISRRHNPLQRCFISYATEDKSFVDRLQKALNERGVDYWYAPEHGRWGEELHQQIDLEISLRDRMLLVCSEVSLKKDWVKYEIDRAIDQEEKRGSRVIFPIMIDDALLTWNHPRATRIREVLAADFRKATEGKAFEQLPKLLKALGYGDSTKA